ncbi:MAG TPA: penicillin-binding protein activator [Casimicrobiaceae bacterium]|nr:penicillin-binding protein activator [Casimicrobiaceae bacterium]
MRATDIAIVLPLESPDYARAAEAVRDGFLAAAEASGNLRRVRVIGHGDDNVLGGFEGATATGARVVVGPLVRDDLRKVATSDRPLPLTLALNQLDDGVLLPREIYTLALAVESDARVLARRMRGDNVASAVVIGDDAPLMKRFANAFATEWLLTGSVAPQRLSFDASVDGLGALRRDLARTPADGALLALDGPSAALARSFVPRKPAYASSLVNAGLEGAALRDLEGVTFVDIPWVVTPDHPALARLPRRPRENLVLERLYALGLDAFEVARAFIDGVPARLQMMGATGRLTLVAGQLVREGTLATFRQGFVVPHDAR